MQKLDEAVGTILMGLLGVLAVMALVALIAIVNGQIVPWAGSGGY